MNNTIRNTLAAIAIAGSLYAGYSAKQYLDKGYDCLYVKQVTTMEGTKNQMGSNANAIQSQVTITYSGRCSLEDLMKEFRKG